MKNLVDLTYGSNNDVKIAAINALGDYKCSIEQQEAINRLLVPRIQIISATLGHVRWKDG
ncbi:hypothetical protein AB7X19_19225 [Providencia vermicola]